MSSGSTFRLTNCLHRYSHLAPLKPDVSTARWPQSPMSMLSIEAARQDDMVNESPNAWLQKRCSCLLASYFEPLNHYRKSEWASLHYEEWSVQLHITSRRTPLLNHDGQPWCPKHRLFSAGITNSTVECASAATCFSMREWALASRWGFAEVKHIMYGAVMVTLWTLHCAPLKYT